MDRVAFKRGEELTAAKMNQLGKTTNSGLLLPRAPGVRGVISSFSQNLFSSRYPAIRPAITVDSGSGSTSGGSSGDYPAEGDAGCLSVYPVKFLDIEYDDSSPGLGCRTLTERNRLYSCQNIYGNWIPPDSVIAVIEHRGALFTNYQGGLIGVCCEGSSSSDSSSFSDSDSDSNPSSGDPSGDPSSGDPSGSVSGTGSNTGSVSRVPGACDKDVDSKFMCPSGESPPRQIQVSWHVTEYSAFGGGPDPMDCITDFTMEYVDAGGYWTVSNAGWGNGGGSDCNPGNHFNGMDVELAELRNCKDFSIQLDNGFFHWNGSASLTTGTSCDPFLHSQTVTASNIGPHPLDSFSGTMTFQE